MFKPTFLYIKQHEITGILYFGKTVRNPESYNGSGLKWKRILKKHGGRVNTLWYCLFTDQESLVDFAINFSKLNDIVNNPQWANLIEENGLDGANIGHEDFVSTDMKSEISAKITNALISLWENPEYRQKMTNARKEAWTEERHIRHKEYLKLKWTPEAKLLHSKQMTGRKGSKKLKGIPKTIEHNRKNSEALKGKKKSAEHIQAIKDSIMLRKVCRLEDRKVMSVTHFTRWLDRINHLKVATPEKLP